MPKTSPEPAADAYEAKRKRRQAAEQARVDADVAVEQAQLQYDAIRERNTQGDESVTGLDLLTASSEIERRQGLASAAADAVEAARAAEAPAAAEYWVQILAERVLAVSEDHKDTAAHAMAKHLSRYLEQVANRNAVISEAIAGASAAGIQPNRTNDLPFGYAASWGVIPHPRVVYVHGQQVSQIDVDKAIIDVLEGVVRIVGYRLTTRHGHVSIEADQR